MMKILASREKSELFKDAETDVCGPGTAIEDTDAHHSEQGNVVGVGTDKDEVWPSLSPSTKIEDRTFQSPGMASPRQSTMMISSRRSTSSKKQKPTQDYSRAARLGLSTQRKIQRSASKTEPYRDPYFTSVAPPLTPSHHPLRLLINEDCPLSTPSERFGTGVRANAILSPGFSPSFSEFLTTHSGPFSPTRQETSLGSKGTVVPARGALCLPCFTPTRPNSPDVPTPMSPTNPDSATIRLNAQQKAQMTKSISRRLHQLLFHPKKKTGSNQAEDCSPRRAMRCWDDADSDSEEEEDLEIDDGLSPMEAEQMLAAFLRIDQRCVGNVTNASQPNVMESESASRVAPRYFLRDDRCDEARNAMAMEEYYSRESFKSIASNLPYIRTLHKEVPSSVDETWFEQQVAPYVRSTVGAALLSASCDDNDCLTVAAILTHYTTSGFIYGLTEQLQYEDDRISSPRLNIIKAVYKQSGYQLPQNESEWDKGADEIKGPSEEGGMANEITKTLETKTGCVRALVINALIHCAQQRLLRCVESQRLSQQCEIDGNLVAQKGFLNMETGEAQCDTHSTVEEGRFNRFKSQDPSVSISDRAFHTVLAGCTVGAVLPDGKEERAAYKVRDSNASIMELMKFIVSTELEDLTSAGKVFDSSKSEAQTIATGKAHTGSAKTAVGRSTHLLESLLKVFLCVFRSYGHKLGNSSELIEQPKLLASLMEVYRGLLTWGFVLNNYFRGVLQKQEQRPRSVSLMSDEEDGRDSPEKPLPSPSKKNKMSGGGSGGDSEYDSREDSDEPLLHSDRYFYLSNRLCVPVLRAVSRYWSARTATFAQDIAYMQLLECTLLFYEPMKEEEECGLGQGVPEEERKRDGDRAGGNPPLSTSISSVEPSTLKVQYDALVKKMVCRLTRYVQSSHFKVANQALMSLQNPRLMQKFFLPISATKEAGYCPDLFERSTDLLYLFSSIAASDTVLNAPVCAIRRGLSAGSRDLLMDQVVAALRNNRSHWHPAVKRESANALDAILSYLMSLETEEEDF